jgi:cyclophilin family peptidyl-prolyl cis-trans isomerase
MGFFQRNMRLFFLVGIIVMMLSLGSFVFASRLQSAADSQASSSTATPEPSATATETAEATATGTPDPLADVVRSYSAPPEMTIDTSKQYDAVIHLEAGDVTLRLLPNEAPEYVNNFVFLARNRFYDGLTFHRVVPGFVAQAGDPTNTGFNDAGYSLEPESNKLVFDTGVLSMAKAGTRVSSSQFFVTLAPAGFLNGDFTVFGRVTAGLDILQALPERDPASANGQPGAQIRSIEIIERDGS